MAAPAVIAGSFADYRLIKSRGCLQIIIEIPVEAQAAAFDVLGYPMPGIEIPVAVARLNEILADAALSSSRSLRDVAPDRGINRGASKGAAKGIEQPGVGAKVPRPWYDVPPPQRAGIMCAEERFWIFLCRVKNVLISDEDEATNWLYQECGISSRSELKLDTGASPDEQAYQREQLRVFYAVESEYRKWAGMEREVR